MESPTWDLTDAAEARMRARDERRQALKHAEDGGFSELVKQIRVGRPFGFKMQDFEPRLGAWSVSIWIDTYDRDKPSKALRIYGSFLFDPTHHVAVAEAFLQTLRYELRNLAAHEIDEQIRLAGTLPFDPHAPSVLR